jgi:hypothetical protein
MCGSVFSNRPTARTPGYRWINIKKCEWTRNIEVIEGTPVSVPLYPTKILELKPVFRGDKPATNR